MRSLFFAILLILCFGSSVRVATASEDLLDIAVEKSDVGKTKQAIDEDKEVADDNQEDAKESSDEVKLEESEDEDSDKPIDMTKITPEELIANAQQSVETKPDGMEELINNQNKMLQAIQNQLKAGADAGNSESMFYLGILLNTKETGTGDKWIEKSADAGDLEAKKYIEPKQPGYEAGLIAMNDGKRDEAYKNLTIAANDGKPEAQFLLGTLYDEDGDNLTATEWYKKSAAAGYPAAQAVLDMTEKYE